MLSVWTTTLAGNALTLQEAATYTMPQCCTTCLTLWLSEPLQERMAMARELERFQHEEAAAAAAKKARAAALMEEVRTTHEHGWLIPLRQWQLWWARQQCWQLLDSS